jgi:signal transduction histidine kinase
MVNDALVDFRIAIDSLSPNETDMTTALANLRFRLIPRLQSAGLASEWTFADVPDRAVFSREAIFHVQRIIAEAITNVVKHASATRVDVRTLWDAPTQRLTIEIQDDGKGTVMSSEASEPRRGRGVGNIQQRVALVGGVVEWVPPTSGAGTVVRVVLPVA